MPTTPVHDHKPLWVAGQVRATCNDHLWQVLDRHTLPAAVKAGAR